MTPFDQVVVLILLVTAAVAVGCFLVAWVDMALHRQQKPPTNPYEMRRHMLCGIYCNPEDPRPFIHRPRGWGYTLNLRREQLVVTVVVMLSIALIAIAIVTLVPRAG